MSKRAALLGRNSSSMAGIRLLQFPFVNAWPFSQPTAPFQKEKNSYRTTQDY
jgi:hypothetical protein